MIRTGVLRGAVLAVVLAGSLSNIPAAAQGRPQAVPGPESNLTPVLPPTRNVVRVACCRCIDGSVQTVNLNTGAAPWHVQPPSAPAAAAVQVTGAPSSWTSLPPAKWIRHPGPNAVGDYVYTLRILVPNCMLKAAVVLTGSFAADNHASLQVNANAAVNTATTTGFLAPTAIPATTLAPGMNTITVRLHNLHGVTGFLFKGSVTSRCPNEPEKVTPDGLDDQ